MDLINAITHCTICKEYLPLGPRPVFQFSSDSKIIVIGQAPGKKVHETGIPWDDPSGNRLREWMGVDMEIFYEPSMVALVPMGFCYPGKGKSGDLPPRPECAEAWHQKILDHTKKIELTLLIGQYAQKYYLGDRTKKTLTHTVKAFDEYAPKIIPLPHPSPRNNIWLKKNEWFERELIPLMKKRISQLLH